MYGKFPVVRACKFVILLGRVLSHMILYPFGVVNSTVVGILSKVFDCPLRHGRLYAISWVNLNSGLWPSVNFFDFHSICLFVYHLHNSHFKLTFKIAFAIFLVNLLIFTMIRTIQNPSISLHDPRVRQFSFTAFNCFRVARIACYLLLYNIVYLS